WISMGVEASVNRHNLLAPYRVDELLMAHAKPDAIFMHCLPAKRGQEVTAGVIDGPQSVIWDEAENRLHAQKGILAWCLGWEIPNTGRWAFHRMLSPAPTTPSSRFGSIRSHCAADWSGSARRSTASCRSMPIPSRWQRCSARRLRSLWSSPARSNTMGFL